MDILMTLVALGVVAYYLAFIVVMSVLGVAIYKIVKQFRKEMKRIDRDE